MAQKQFRAGDLVVFAKIKKSTHPGPRAREIYATPKGEDYIYRVDKYWIVTAVQPVGTVPHGTASNGTVTVQTRRGKRHTLSATHDMLRHASFWEKLFLRDRFPSQKDLAEGAGTADSPLDDSADARADQSTAENRSSTKASA